MVWSNFAFFLTTGRCRGARHGSARPRARPCRAAAGRLLQQLLQFFFKPRLSPSSASPPPRVPVPAPHLHHPRASASGSTRGVTARTRRPGSGCCRGRGGGGGFTARLSRGAADEPAPRHGGDGVAVGSEDSLGGFTRVLALRLRWSRILYSDLRLAAHFGQKGRRLPSKYLLLVHKSWWWAVGEGGGGYSRVRTRDSDQDLARWRIRDRVASRPAQRKVRFPLLMSAVLCLQSNFWWIYCIHLKHCWIQHLVMIHGPSPIHHSGVWQSQLVLVVAYG